jgi:serine/threonine protein kinase
MRDAKVLRYADYFSTFALWWKAALLTPLWAFFLIPVIGGMAARMGNAALQLGFSVVLAVFMSMFIEDLLKCKIRIENDVLFFGYRTFRLAELASVGLLYKENHVLPRAIVLNFHSGKKLKLKISRLKAEDAETLLKYIETRHPEAKVDPVIRTLAKAKKLARNTALDTENAVEIPYASRRIFRQLFDTFMSTAEKWIRVGPLLAFIACSPIWLGLFSNMFTVFNTNSYELGRSLLMKKGLERIIEKFHGEIGMQIGRAGSWFMTVVENPFVALAMFTALVCLVYYLARLFFRPNVIMMQPDSMALQLRVLNASADIDRVSYRSLASAYLLKPKKSADSDKWKVVFKRHGGLSDFKLSLGALTAENRARFAKALERLAPNCTIDPELAEAMIPRQERSYTELWLQSLSAPPERKNLEPLAPAQTLQEGRYEVLRRLGVGGQGAAYLSRDTSELHETHQTEVVLKETILPVFVEQTVRQQALERFQQEAKLLEEFNHDGIVKLLDYFIEDHRGYLVLEHIDGKTLRQLVEEDGPLSEERARELGTQMCEILIYLHERGVIHRDFTPDNLILRHDGRLKLIDFNVAQQVQDGATGTIVGKHAFLPPEQFRGKSTFQSDIYAMGATLFFLTTGRDPEPITKSRPAEHNLGVSEEFDKFVAGCTELQCSKRTKSAADAYECLTGASTKSAADGSECLTAASTKSAADGSECLTAASTKSAADGSECLTAVRRDETSDSESHPPDEGITITLKEKDEILEAR